MIRDACKKQTCTTTVARQCGVVDDNHCSDHGRSDDGSPERHISPLTLTDHRIAVELDGTNEMALGHGVGLLANGMAVCLLPLGHRQWLSSP